MKKNLSLLGILILLLLSTYFFHEKKIRHDFEVSLTKDRLFSDADIVSIGWGNVEAVKKNKQWWSGQQLLSHNSFHQLEKQLLLLRRVKQIPGEKGTFFSKATSFKVNGVDFLLGDMAFDRQGFYLARGNEIMIASIDGASGEITDDEAKLEEIKYLDLKKKFDQTLSDVTETQLFRFYPQLSVSSILIESENRPSFELNLKLNETVPAPIEGISVHEKIGAKFLSLLTQVTIKKEVQYSEKLKKHLLGKISFTAEQSSDVWELWLSSTQSADSYIIDSKNKRAWLMIGGTLKPFFVNLQDFWDKKVIPHSDLKPFSRVRAHFIQDDKSAEVQLINSEPLGFETAILKVDYAKMSLLFEYLLNLGDKDQADRVSQLTKSEKKMLLSGSHLRVEIFSQEILFWKKQEELILVNLTRGFKAHFFYLNNSFLATFSDVLK